jgi:thiol-disulfide isomerase/thioredoxin
MLRVCSGVRAPVLAGVVRPAILLPEEWFSWSRFKRRCVLAHEAAHIRRKDPLFAFTRRLMISLYWFHPLAWWLHRELRALAENAADDRAARVVRNRIGYGRVLVELAALARRGRIAVLTPAMADSSKISVRVRRILESPQASTVSRRARLAVSLLSAASALVACSLPVIPGARQGMVLSIAFLRQQQATGRIYPELIVNPVGGQAEDLTPATTELRAILPETLNAADKVWSGWTSIPGRKMSLIVIEPAGDRRPALYADLNDNGKFEQQERFEFEPTSADDDAWGDVMLKIPLRNQPFDSYPLRLRFPKPGKEPFGTKSLIRTPFAYVSGTVKIGGRDTLVWIQYHAKKGGAWPDYGWQGVDTDGDGRIRTGANSPEYTFAKDEHVIFHAAGRDVSISSVDLASKTFQIREHPASANVRVDLDKGTVVPDFSFKDLQGKPRRLVEFRGQYVLLDFWGTWCGPCVRILPELQKVQERFRRRGLVVLGLPSHEQDGHSVRSVLRANGATFLQAEPESVKDLVEQRFRINVFPTHVLVDPEGRIAETGERLRPPGLTSFLDSLLPASFADQRSLPRP